jgi:hypothetical protein
VTPSIRHAANEGVVRYRERSPDRPPTPDVRPPRSDGHDYWKCGSHPDIVERVWDQLGRELPEASRVVVLGTPGLVHPESGVVIALALGTQYGLRLPIAAWAHGLPPGVVRTTTWSGGETMDIGETIGPDWVFGTWAPAEERWCRDAYEESREPRTDPTRAR